MLGWGGWGGVLGLLALAGPASAQEVDTGAPPADTGVPSADPGAEAGPDPREAAEAVDTGTAEVVDTGAVEAVDTGASEPVDTGAPEPVDTGAAQTVDTGTPEGRGAGPARGEGEAPTEAEPPAEAAPAEEATRGPRQEELPSPGAEGSPEGGVEGSPLPGPVAPAPVEEEASPPEPLPDVPFSPPTPDEGPSIERYRVPFAVLADRAIGTTSTPVEFDWRRNKVQVGVWGSFLSELNNFNSLRGGALVRLPSKGLIWEVGLSYVAVGDTAASRDLALTPYRQAGRPRRGELDVGVAAPLAEGVVTTVPRWFPAVQMVLQGYVDLRYRVYPTAYRGMTVGEVARSIVDPQLSPLERNNLEEARLQAMTVDRERFGLLMGVGNDFYFKPGLFLSPRVMFSVPLLAPVTETQLLWWSDAQLAVGAAF